MWGNAASFLLGTVFGAISMLVFAHYLITDLDKLDREFRAYAEGRGLMPDINISPRRDRDDQRRTDESLAESDGKPLDEREEWNYAEVEKRGERDDE
jgi:hypothetical protein